MFLPTTSIFNDLPWGLMYQCVAEMCIYAAVPSGNHQMKTTPSIGYNTVVYVLKKLWMLIADFNVFIQITITSHPPNKSAKHILCMNQKKEVASFLESTF